MAQTPNDPVDVFLQSLLPNFNNDLFNFGPSLDSHEPSPVDDILSEWPNPDPQYTGYDGQPGPADSTSIHSPDSASSPISSSNQHYSSPTSTDSMISSPIPLPTVTTASTVPNAQGDAFHHLNMPNQPYQDRQTDASRKKRARTEDVVADILSDKPDPKRQHVLRDKARRHDLNDGIERLRQLLSFELGPKPTKSDIVHAAADSLTKLQSQVAQLTAYLHQIQGSPSSASSPSSTSPASYAVPMGSPPVLASYDPNSNSSFAQSNSTGLFFAFIFVFIVGSFTPISHLAAPMTRSLLGFDASDPSGSTSLSYISLFLLASFIMYIARLLLTNYVPVNSVKYQRVRQTMRTWNAFKSDRSTFRLQANLVRQLLGRQIPQNSAYRLIFLYIEFVRFVLLRLRIGLFIERLVLLLKRVSPEVMELEISSSLAWLETKPSWDSNSVIFECMQSLNLIEITKHSPDNTNLIFLKLSFYYLIGNLIGYRSALWKPLSLWCLWCASSLADSVPDPDPNDAPKTLTTDEMSLSRTSALLGAVGIRTFKEFARNGQSASKDILGGRITSARLKFEDTLKALEPAMAMEASAPLLHTIRRGTRSIMLFLKYVMRRDDYAAEAVELFQEADKCGDRELSLTVMIIIIYTKCWLKDSHSMQQTRRLTAYCRARFQNSLTSDVMMGFTLTLAEIIVQIYDNRIIHALALLETSADFLEEHKKDPRLLVAPIDFSRLCLRMVKVVAESEDEDVRQTLPRIMDVAFRAVNLLEVQSVTAKFAEPLWNYYKGRLDLVQTNYIPSDISTVRSSAKKKFERCAALCREFGLQDWNWLHIKCEKRIALIEDLTGSSSSVAQISVLSHRRSAAQSAEEI